MNEKKLPRHWHITREIRPRGECPACDIHWDRVDFEKANTPLPGMEDMKKQGGVRNG